LASRTEARIYRDAALCVGFLIVSAIVPRFVPNQEGGFASATSAVLVFLVMLLGAAIFSLVLLIRTVKAFPMISAPARIAGIGPCVLLVTGLVLLLGFLRY
jgi:hypothetical protein